MDGTARTQHVSWLVAGDLLVLALVTVFGFAMHGTVSTAGMRMLTTFIPLAIAWFLAAPHLGVFDFGRVADLRQLWRPFWAMILAGPLAAWVRGAWLNSPILPVFVVALCGVSALSLALWRLLYWLFVYRKK
jgi:hypothetical protein